MTDSSSDRPELLDVLSGGPVGVSSPEETEAAREQMLPWLEQQVESLPAARSRALQRARFRRSAWMAGGALAVAAGAALTLFVDTKERAPAPQALVLEPAVDRDVATVVSGGLTLQSGDVTAGQTVPLRGRVDTRSGQRVALQTSRGYQVELGPSTGVSFESPETGDERGSNDVRLRLHEGYAKFSVLPLPEGSSFKVVTGDVLVSVIGTAFTMNVKEGEPTCVRVSEGRVAADRSGDKRTLGPGEAWGCDEEPPAKRDAPQSGSVGAKTTLPQENALLTKALAAESRGDWDSARASYRKLLSQYPRSSFAQDARAGLERLDRQIK